jgi:hypothetical protein
MEVRTGEEEAIITHDDSEMAQFEMHWRLGRGEFDDWWKWLRKRQARFTYLRSAFSEAKPPALPSRSVRRLKLTLNGG